MTTTEHDETGIADLFPGPGLDLPSDEERQRADDLVAQWNVRWGENHPPIPRTRTVTDNGHTYDVPTNRAYLRSKLRRWWRHPTGQPHTSAVTAQPLD
jgi:hypothetical protein